MALVENLLSPADSILADSSDGKHAVRPAVLAGLVALPVVTMMVGSLVSYFVAPPQRFRALVSAFAGGLLLGSVGFELGPELTPDNGGHPMRSTYWNAAVLFGVCGSLILTTVLTMLSIAMVRVRMSGGDGRLHCALLHHRAPLATALTMTNPKKKRKKKKTNTAATLKKKTCLLAEGAASTVRQHNTTNSPLAGCGSRCRPSSRPTAAAVQRRP